MSLLDNAREERDNLGAELDALLAAVETEERTAFTEDEDAKFAELRTAIEAADANVEKFEKIEELRSAKAAEIRKVASVAVVNEPNPIYRKDNHGVSFFRDLAAVHNPMTPGVGEARERLVAAQETRATGTNISPDGTTVAGHGGEFAPPAWLVSEFVSLARPGRVAADRVNKQALPSGVSSINIPALTTGTSVAVQGTQGSNISETALVTTSVSSGIVTLAGKSVLPIQLLEQSGIAFDQMVLQDLARAYGAQVDVNVLYGATGLGSSLSSVAGTTAGAVTGTSVSALYTAVTKAVAAIQTAVFESPDTILMHPRRWAAILGASDSQGRPLVVPAGPAMNPAGQGNLDNAQGYVGTFAGFPVFIDSQIVTNLGAATNQDEIYVYKMAEQWTWESAVTLASFDATYADNLSILYRVHGYMASIQNRRANTVQKVSGAGLVAP